MKIVENIFKSLVLPAIFAWFFLTIFVDIFTVPTVFRTIKDIPVAGQVGIKVFSAMNNFEIIFAITTLIGSFSFYKHTRSIKWLVFALPLMIWSLFYKYFMTPKIANTTFEINQTDVMDPMYAVLQSTHAYYHNLYRYFDTSKLIFLLIFIIIVLIDLAKKSQNEVGSK